MAVGLRDLTFTDNFKSFTETVEIPATSETRIRNKVSFIPDSYIIVKQSGNGLVTKSTTEWTNDYLYLYNNGGETVTIKVVFLR